MPERVVFLGENSVKTNLTRLRGRSLRETRLTSSAPFGSCENPDLDRRTQVIRSDRTVGNETGDRRPRLCCLHPHLLIPKIDPDNAVILGKLCHRL